MIATLTLLLTLSAVPTDSSFVTMLLAKEAAEEARDLAEAGQSIENNQYTFLDDLWMRTFIYYMEEYVPIHGENQLFMNYHRAGFGAIQIAKTHINSAEELHKSAEWDWSLAESASVFTYDDRTAYYNNARHHWEDALNTWIFAHEQHHLALTAFIIAIDIINMPY